MYRSISFHCINRRISRPVNKLALKRRYIFIPAAILFLILSCLQAEEAVAGSEFIFGVTIDDPWNDPAGQHAEINDALSSHAIKPTVRIVFDEGMPAAEYRTSVDNIKQVAFVMGEILDSAVVENSTVQEYLDRTEEYLDEFEDTVDIWEIGNEVNGDWLGNTADVVAKIEGAYTAVKDRGRTAALNLYYNKSCSESEHEMFTWVQVNIPPEMRDGLDYVFFSYYEDVCHDVIHTQEEWQVVFDRLHVLFPKAKLGFGEIGTEDADKKAEYMQRYYSLDIKGDYYVGGYFWWYYKQDAIPKTTELWGVLNTILLERESRSRGWLVPVLFLLL